MPSHAAHHGSHADSSGRYKPVPSSDAHEAHGTAHYRRLLIMSGLSFISMFILMYAMVNAFGNVFMNVNQVYMAALMTAPMVLIELALMRAMYLDSRLNMIVGACAVIVAIAMWGMIRRQAAVGDEQFLRSMIPHHAGAILMCQNAPLTDPAIKELCRGIVASQQAEIDLMKAKLNDLGK